MFVKMNNSKFQAELRETLRLAAEKNQQIKAFAKMYKMPERTVAWYAESYEDWQEVLRFNASIGVVL